MHHGFESTKRNRSNLLKDRNRKIFFNLTYLNPPGGGQDGFG